MCPHEDQVTAWLLGDLPAEEQEAMTRHVASCETCRAMRDELSSVLMPLQSGLAKDGNIPLPARAPVRQRNTRPFTYGWLRRAALFAVSFGMLFAFISLMHQQAAKQPADGPVTSITFNKSQPPAPALAPLDAPKDVRRDAIAVLDDEPRRDLAPAPSPSVAPPALPSPEPHMPALRSLVAAEAKSEAASAPRAAPAAALPDPDEKAYARKEKQAADARDRSELSKKMAGAKLVSKPISLAKTGTLSTNALPPTATATNNASTNALPANTVSNQTTETKP